MDGAIERRVYAMGDEGYLMMARRLIRHHEGLRLKPYEDSTGHVTIGVGRNLTERGISKSEAEMMFDSDLIVAEGDARHCVPNFERHSLNRRAALVDLAFNLGRGRLLEFKRFRAAMADYAYELASLELEDSRWYGQVGERGETITAMIRTAIIPGRTVNAMAGYYRDDPSRGAPRHPHPGGES